MTAALESVVQERQFEQIDREKTCPLLLRVFCTYGRHHSLYDYQKGIFPLNEFQIYTWLDATLREITNLIKEVNPEAKERGTTFDFQLVMPDRFSSRYLCRDIGTTCCGQKSPDDEKTLNLCKFVIGDYMDVNITLPTRNQGGPMRRGGGPRYRN
ncbi:histone deacetylase complex subunit SAP18 [Planococcus citri]|uniref:histone deacetylase complex subunit SAP18 n=1 Tax=Planococcus citri TaxID=170843 RepID=UPI0031F883BE